MHAIDSLSVLFTGGDDYLVRVMPTLHDGDFQTVSVEDATMQITWLDCDSNYLITASEDDCVRLYILHKPDDVDGSLALTKHGEHYEPWQMETLLTRCTLPARCAALERAVPAFADPDDPSTPPAPRVAVCSDELTVKVISIGDPLDVHLLSGHTRPVRHASWSPTEQLLLTSSCDGTVRVWDMSLSNQSATPECTQVIKDILPVTRQSDTSRASVACWHPSGRLFLLPSKTNEIVIMGRKTGSDREWERKAVFNGSSQAFDPPTGSITAMDFSSNGRYLATATAGNGQITIWDVATKSPIKRRVAESDVTSISWHPNRNALAWADLQGQLYRWDEPIHSSSAAPFDPLAAGAAVSRKQAHRNKQPNGKHAHGAASKMVDLDADAEEDEFGDEFGDVDMDLLDDEGGEGLDDEEAAGMDDIDGFVVDDEGGDYARELLNEERARKRRALAKKRRGHMVAGTVAQPTFQPTATPMKDQRRFLAFNTIGTLVAVDQDNHQSITFEAYDTSARRNYRFQDAHKFTMAALGYHGAVFACEEKEELNSSILFRPFDTMWGGSSGEWSFDLPKGESAVCVAIGGPPPQKADVDEVVTDAASVTTLVATSAGYIRIFSAAGLQRFIWQQGGQVISMAAGNHTAMIVARGPGAALGGYQNLTFTLIDLQTLATINQGSLPLPKDAQLRWLGLNEYDTPAIYDSRGVLSVLDGARSGYSAKWVPVLDTRMIPGAASGADILYWPINVLSSRLLIIMLKGATTFPDAAATRPLVQDLDFSMPILESGTHGQMNQHEETWLRQSLIASMIRGRPAALDDVEESPDAIETNADKALLQLIQLSCKSDKHKKAIDAARELRTSRTLDAAIKIAQYFQLPSLVNRMDRLRNYVETRKERIEEVGHIFASSSVSDAPRVLVPASQDSVAAAKKAITQDFAPRHSKRDMPSGMPSSSSMSTFSPAEPPAARRLRLEQELALEEQQEEEALRRAAVLARAEDESMDAEHPGKENQDPEDGSFNRGLKRKPAEDSMPPPSEKRSMSMSMTKSSESRRFRGGSSCTADHCPSIAGGNPFQRKPAGSNPFARAPGNITRDRSMHKSNSFFERVDAVESGKPIAEPAAKKKQSKLFGFTSKAQKEQKTTDAAAPTPAFAETQEPDATEDAPTGGSVLDLLRREPASGDAAAERAFEADMEAEESLRATLQSARSKEQESMRLEETQMETQNEETQFVPGTVQQRESVPEESAPVQEEEKTADAEVPAHVPEKAVEEDEDMGSARSSEYLVE